MKEIKLIIDDTYGKVLSITAVGTNCLGIGGCSTNVTTCAVDMSKINCIEIDKIGKSHTYMLPEEGTKTDE
jgi:hypothetical protein